MQFTNVVFVYVLFLNPFYLMPNFNVITRFCVLFFLKNLFCKGH